MFAAWSPLIPFHSWILKSPVVQEVQAKKNIMHNTTRNGYFENKVPLNPLVKHLHIYIYNVHLLKSPWCGINSHVHTQKLSKIIVTDIFSPIIPKKWRQVVEEPASSTATSLGWKAQRPDTRWANQRFGCSCLECLEPWLNRWFFWLGYRLVPKHRIR